MSGGRHVHNQPQQPEAMALSKETRQRIGTLIQTAQTVFHYTFIPTVVWLGLNTGSEPLPGIMSLFGTA
eukprot:m.56386 g.56386  ORF g.56386 m.56386 type:complete len:69 (-) comp7002_c0_seq1:94-300(-)